MRQVAEAGVKLQAWQRPRLTQQETWGQGGWLSGPPGARQHLAHPQGWTAPGRVASGAGRKAAERWALSADCTVGRSAVPAPLRDSAARAPQPHPHCWALGASQVLLVRCPAGALGGGGREASSCPTLGSGSCKPSEEAGDVLGQRPRRVPVTRRGCGSSTVTSGCGSGILVWASRSQPPGGLSRGDGVPHSLVQGGPRGKDSGCRQARGRRGH